MNRKGWDSVWRPLLLTIGIALVYGLGTLGTLTLFRMAGNVSIIWIASSVLGGGLLLLPRRWGVACSLACWLLGIAVYAADPMG